MWADVWSLYRRENLLGSGTYGNVYRAVRYSDRQEVAVKQIKLDQHDEGVPATALREIIVLKALGHHPYIVSLVDVVHSEKCLSMVFEYYSSDLHQFLSRLRKQRRALSMEQIQTFTRQMLSALEFMHSHNIAHRDIKPSNLLISGFSSYNSPPSDHSTESSTSTPSNGPLDNKEEEEEDTDLLSLHIADFGLARPIGAPARQNSCNVVSLWYRAPELLRGNSHYTTAIDIWSAGCVLVEMLNGSACFRTKEPAQQTSDGQLAEIQRVLDIGWPNYITHPEYQLNEDDDADNNDIPTMIDNLLNGALHEDQERRMSASELLLLQ